MGDSRDPKNSACQITLAINVNNNDIKSATSSRKDNLENEIKYAVNGPAKNHLNERNQNNNRREPNGIMQKLGIICVFLASFIVGFVLYGMNMIYVGMMDFFDVTRAEAALLPTVFVLVPTVLRLFTVQMIRKLGPGIAICIGGCVAGSGFIVASFVTSFPIVIVLVGVFSGFGNSTLLVSSYIAPTKLASGRQSHLVTTIVAVGASVGQSVGVFAIKYLMDYYHYQGSMLIIGGLYLQTCVCGMCLWSVLRSSHHESKDEERKRCGGEIMLLLKNTPFVALMVADVMCLSLVYSYILFIVDNAEDAGHTRETGALFASIFGFGSLIGKIVTGLIHQVKRWHGIYQYCVIAFCLGACLTAVPFLHMYWGLLSVTIALGLLTGPMLSYVFIVLYEVVDSDLYPLAAGFHFIMIGIATVLSSPLGGWIRDTTGSYNLLFFAGLPVCGVAAVMLSGVFAISSCLKKGSVKLN